MGWLESFILTSAISRNCACVTGRRRPFRLLRSLADLPAFSRGSPAAWHLEVKAVDDVITVGNEPASTSASRVELRAELRMLTPRCERGPIAALGSLPFRTWSLM